MSPFSPSPCFLHPLRTTPERTTTARRFHGLLVPTRTASDGQRGVESKLVHPGNLRFSVGWSSSHSPPKTISLFLWKLQLFTPIFCCSCSTFLGVKRVTNACYSQKHQPVPAIQKSAMMVSLKKRGILKNKLHNRGWFILRVAGCGSALFQCTYWKMIECIECSDFAESFVACQCLHINRGCCLPHYTAIVKYIKTEIYIYIHILMILMLLLPKRGLLSWPTIGWSSWIMSFLWHQSALFVDVVLVAPIRVVCWFNSFVDCWLK